MFNKGESGSLARFVAFMPRKRALAIRLRTDEKNYPDKYGLIGEKNLQMVFPPWRRRRKRIQNVQWKSS